MKLGDRIKRYEAVTHNCAINRMPLMIRVDGRAFHTFTRGMDKPFDQHLINCMVDAAKSVSKDMQGFKVAYVQSDEVTFCLTDYDRIESQGWFDYDLSKIISLSASLMTVYFDRLIDIKTPPTFDSRAFNVPKHDVVNAFLWRAKDWQRNSIQMYAQANFSHKQLYGKKQPDMHEMLHSIGKNWTIDLTNQQKNGTFLILEDERHDILPNYKDINNAIGHLFDYPQEQSE